MEFRETETVELKSIVVDDIKKEIIAFANCNGGKLYIGVNDDGSICGIDNPDEVTQQIVNMVRDSIKPDVTMFIHYEAIEQEGKQIVVADIQRGTNSILLERVLDRKVFMSGKGHQRFPLLIRQFVR